MLNVIALVGRLTRDPEIKTSQKGTSIGAFTIAVGNGKDTNGEKQTLFMDCNLFGSQVDVLSKYFHKGDLIGVYGRLTSRKFVNNQGANVTYYSVNCDRVEFGGEKRQSAEGEAPSNPQPASPVVESKNLETLDVDDSELPF